MHFDDLLINYVGEWGKAQILIFIATSLTAIPAVFHVLGIVFLAASPEHWCVVSEVKQLNFTEEVIKNLTIPLVKKDGVWSYSSCLQYNVNFTGWNNNDVQDTLGSDIQEKWGTTPCWGGWDYDFSVYTSTIVTQWDLVCDRAWLRATTTAVYMAGCMIGVVIIGTFSDKFGRLTIIWICWLLMSICSVAQAFSPNIIFFMICRFFLAAFTLSLYTTAFVLLMETVGPSRRVFTGTMFHLVWCAGTLAVAGLAYGIRDWYTLQLTLALVPLFLVAFFWYLPESPRWLYVQAKTDRAYKIVRKMARFNNKGDIPENLEVYIETQPKAFIWDLIKTTHLRFMTINMCFQWLVSALVYYGITLGISDLGGNVYINFLFGVAVEIPAYLFSYLLMVKVGRKLSLGGAMISGGLVMLCNMAVPSDLHWLVVAIAIFGKFCITIAFQNVYIYTLELFPTVLRNTAVGTCSLSGRIGSMISPYIIQLAMISKYIPYTAYGTLCVCAAGLVVFLPETKGKRLPETLEDGEAFSKSRELPSILKTIYKKMGSKSNTNGATNQHSPTYEGDQSNNTL